MTLRIKICGIQNLKKKNGYLFVEGSSAGLLMSEKIPSSDLKFKILCSNKDNLFIRYCKNKSALMEGNFYGLGEFHCEAFVKKNIEELNPKKSIQAEIILYDKESIEAGTLKLKIKYDRVRHYQGEVWSNNNQQRQKIKLYKGTVPTKNLFSFFDPNEKDKPSKWVQSYYKDQK